MAMDDLDDGAEPQITDKEAEDIVAGLTESDIQSRSQALHETQEIWEELQFMSTPKIPCRECGGSGSVGSGSFGSICVNCMGERMVAAPGAPEFEMPDFRTMRKQIGAYGDALALGKALPPGQTVPTLEAIKELKEKALVQCRQLQLADGGIPGTFDPKQLPEARPDRGLAGEGELGEYTDAEFDEIENEAKEIDRRKRGPRK